MIRGFWERRYDKMCESIYLIDREKKLFYTMEFKVHKFTEGTLGDATEVDMDDSTGLLKALAEALQQGGYIPKSAVDSELKATKYHLEDMRQLALKPTSQS